MSVLTQVRTATRSIHKSLDEHPLLVRFMRYHEVNAYRGFLEAFRAFVALELHHNPEYIEVSDREILDYNDWRKALEGDLFAIGARRHQAHLPNVSMMVPALNNRSEFWGFLYVVEGSVLGGRDLAKALPEEWPKEFLLRGSQNRLRWPYFTRRFTELENTGKISSDAVEKGAVRSFESMIAMFDAFKFGSGEPVTHDHSSSS
jgi:heme oxygenase